MKTINSATLAIVLSVGTTHAGVITLGNSWTAGIAGTGSAVAISGESATGFTLATKRNGWAYQVATDGDFTAHAFNVGDTVTMSFTTTVNSVGASSGLSYRFAIWDQVNQGGASVRMDWGAATGAKVAAIGAGDNMHFTTPISPAIGSWDFFVSSGTLIPTKQFTAGQSVDVSFSMTKVSATEYDMSLTWDDMTFSTTTSLKNETDDPINFISGVGIRNNGPSGIANDLTISNLSVQVQSESESESEPPSAALLGLGGITLILSSSE